MDTQKEIKPKRQNPKVDRVVLKPDASARLDAWASEISERVKTKVTKSDLTNWIISTRPPSLTEDELSAIEKLFFDEIKYAEWMLKRLRDAKDRGESLVLSDLIPSNRPA